MGITDTNNTQTTYIATHICYMIYLNESWNISLWNLGCANKGVKHHNYHQIVMQTTSIRIQKSCYCYNMSPGNNLSLGCLSSECDTNFSNMCSHLLALVLTPSLSTILKIMSVFMGTSCFAPGCFELASLPLLKWKAFQLFLTIVVYKAWSWSIKNIIMIEKC